MILDILSTLPFITCLNWLAILAIHYPEASTSKRVLTWFGATCTVLYFCHALYFNNIDSLLVEMIWNFCTLTVYPLYYLYILSLTEYAEFKKKWLAVVLPALIVALLVPVLPDSIIFILRQLVFIPSIICVVYLGLPKLWKFDNNLDNAYSYTEGRKLKTIGRILIYFVIISLCSAVVSSIGREFFKSGALMLVIPSLLFTILLFFLFHAGYTRDFTIVDFERDNALETIDVEKEIMPDSELEKTLNILMKEKKLYLMPDLKIADLARETNSNRTYISAFINQRLGMTFSDYINKQRIEFALYLMNVDESMNIYDLSTKTGFASVSSFKRNYRKFTGKNVMEYFNS